MQKTKTLIRILLILTLVSSIILINRSDFAVAMEPAKLKIYAGPASIPADNNVYECIFVQLQDSASRPARALQSTTISLSSSLTSVGDVDPTITIAEGSTFAVAKFDTTFTPGTTTIAAAASGYATVQIALTTVAPVPSKLAVYGFPPVLPADAVQYDALVVQLQDSSSNPAKAPLEGITVTLSSSNSTIASVPVSVTISSGQTYTVASIISSAVGSATITALSSGYTTAQTTIASQQPSTTQPKSLKIYVAPPRTLADKTENQQIVVQLLNATGKITQQLSTNTTIQLSSSNEDVGKVQPTIEIPSGKVYALATFLSTFKAGTTTITAAATDLTADTESVTTIGPIPTKLAVYCNPSVLPADNEAYGAIQVQLQDASGKPALDPDGDVTISLFSSEPTVGTVSETLTIPFGKTYAMTTFESTYLGSSTAITVQASGYTTGTATMKTYQIDNALLAVAVAADPIMVPPGNQTVITVHVTDPGANPVAGATVTFASSNGGTFTKVKALENGDYTTTLTVQKFKTPTNITVTAAASKTDYTTSNGTIQITVALPVKTGVMQLCIKDDNEQPVEDVQVSSLSQPSGMTELFDITNSTGYVTFSNASEGNYKFNLYKQGYISDNVTLAFKTNSTAKTLYMTKSGDNFQSGGNQPASDLTMVWLILGAVIAVVAVVTVVTVRKRRRKSTFSNSLKVIKK